METLVDLLRESAERFGPATALSIKPGFRQQRWSYGRLWEFSGRVAAFLVQRGLTKGDRAILWAPNRPEWVVAFFGCLRAGIVVVPLDVRSAADFVARVIRQTEPKLAFLSRHTPQGLENLGLPLILLEDMEQLLEEMPPSAQEPPLTGEDLAEVIFTSGTTGDPKGVMLTHRNILSNALAATGVVPSQPWYRFLSLLPLSHMLEQTVGLLAPLSGGGQVVYPVSRQPSIIFKTMKENRITTVALVPQALQLFLNAIEREVRRQGREKQWQLLLRLSRRLPFWARRWLFRAVHRQFGGRLNFFICGGAYLDPELAQTWEALGVRVLQGYGTTETSPIITNDTFERKRWTAVGQALPGQEVRIAVDGEILTRGPNVTRGYWQNHQATAASFEDGWYKTGDLGYLDDEGFLYLKGRKKDLIVLANGQNVYPEDIETLLHKQPEVEDGVVVGLPKEAGGVEVHAVLLMPDPSQAPSVIRAVNTSLADHQQIQGHTIWPEEDFPRTHTLKVKKAMVLEYLMGRDQEESSVPHPSLPEGAGVASNHFLRVVAEVCAVPPAELTPEKTLGFDLNLDSLGRVELLSAIEQELGVYIDEGQVVPTTTVGELEALAQAGGTAQTLPFPQWGRSAWCRVLRAILQYGIIFPLLRLFYGFKVVGREHLAGLQHPVVFAANHNFKMDNPLIFMALPFSWLWRLCPAAAADDIFGYWQWRIAGPLLGNAFPFAREGAVRPSLEHLGQLLDGGWSVLIFPEGHSTAGDIKPFLGGTGLIAVESRIPVVPVRVVVRKGSAFDRAPLLSRGKAEVRFGRPMTFGPNTHYLEATAQLEKAVKAL